MLYIQMQLCELTLRDYLRTEGRDTSLEASKPYFLQLLAGLQHIHRNSLIHRDLTPANVFITSDRSTIKIGDFGLSREMTSELPVVASSSANLDLALRAGREQAERIARRSERREHLRSVTRGVGTTLYMSPEQRACKPYDHKVGQLRRTTSLLLPHHLPTFYPFDPLPFPFLHPSYALPL